MITINSATGFTDDELSILSRAVDKVNAIIAAPAFSAGVLAITNFACTPDPSATIASRIVAAVAGSMPLALDFFIFDPTFWQRHFSREIAYEDSQGIHFMRTKFDEESFAEVCNTVAHEACHCPPLSYTHPFNECADRDNSVPYQIGDLIEALANA